jgi:hypothetical protein
MNSMTQRIASNQHMIAQGGLLAANDDNINTATTSRGEPQFLTWAWVHPVTQINSFHRTPSSFRFPRDDTKKTWDLWWGGDRARKICPYRILQSIDLYDPRDKQIMSKARKVIEAIESKATELNLINSVNQRLETASVQRRDQVFEQAFPSLCKEIFEERFDEEDDMDKRRIGDMSILTVYDHMARANQRKRSRIN